RFQRNAGPAAAAVRLRVEPGNCRHREADLLSHLDPRLLPLDRGDAHRRLARRDRALPGPRVGVWGAVRPAIEGEDAPRGVATEMGGGVNDCQVVAACLNHELALEDMTDGVRHGLLTRAFVTHMRQVDSSEVRSVPWARLWQKMRDSVEK